MIQESEQHLRLANKASDILFNGVTLGQSVMLDELCIYIIMPMTILDGIAIMPLSHIISTERDL